MNNSTTALLIFIGIMSLGLVSKCHATHYFLFGSWIGRIRSSPKRYQSTVAQSIELVSSPAPLSSSHRSRHSRMFRTAQLKGDAAVDTVNNPLQNIVNKLSEIANHLEVIADNPFQHENIQLCINEMDRINLNTLGIHSVSNRFASLKRMECIQIIQTEHFEISAFILPKGFEIPLHSHPQMSVITKVLCGKLLVQSFTPIVKPKPSHNSPQRREQTIPVEPTVSSTSSDRSFSVSVNDTACARIAISGRVYQSTDKPWILTTNVGNIHSFHAESDCIVLDIIFPPYNGTTRVCRFYESVNEGGVTKDSGTIILRELDSDAEDDIQLPVLVHYNGYKPQIPLHEKN